MNASLPLSIPAPPRGRDLGAFGLALAMHLLLLAMLLIGLRWQSHPPVAAQAELWSAPPPPLTRDAPPAPVVKPAPTPPRPAPEAAPPAPDPDIALQARRREQERLQRERLEREAQARRKAELAAQEAAAKREAQARREAQQQREAQQREAQAQQLAQARARQEAQARQRDEAKKAELAKREADAKAEAAAQEPSRADHVKRLLEQAGSGEKAGRAGAAVGAEAGGASGAAMGSWGAKVSAHIRANTVFQLPPDLRGNPKAEFIVSLMPDGSIANLRLSRSSGVPAWDQAAERAIRRSDPLPRPPVGAPRDVTIVQGPRDE